MKISQNPYRLIMDAVLFLLPLLKLCLGLEPMHSINYVIPKRISIYLDRDTLTIIQLVMPRLGSKWLSQPS